MILLLDGEYIRSKNFTDGTDYNFEPLSSLMDKNDDYGDCFDCISAISFVLAEEYLKLICMDSICYNMDRHTENLGFLRDVRTGEIVSVAPNYDNNIALISRGYPSSTNRENDGLIRFLEEFIIQNPAAREMYRNMKLPQITQEIIDECLAEIPIEADRKFICEFILSGQSIVGKIINGDI